MILLLIGTAACYSALVASALLIRSEDWWTPHPTLINAALSLGLVPLLAAWVGAELARWLRTPRVLTRHAHPLKRLLTGLTIGLIGSVLGALSVVLLEPANGGLTWLLLGGSSLIASAGVLSLSRRTQRGRCARCDYDLSGVTVAALGKCPECGLDQMAG